MNSVAQVTTAVLNLDSVKYGIEHLWREIAGITGRYSARYRINAARGRHPDGDFAGNAVAGALGTHKRDAVGQLAETIASILDEQIDGIVLKTQIAVAIGVTKGDHHTVHPKSGLHQRRFGQSLKLDHRLVGIVGWLHAKLKQDQTGTGENKRGSKGVFHGRA